MQTIDLTAKDGAVLHAVTIGLDDSNIKAIIIISHGFGEHSGSYIELAEDLHKAGFASIIPDQRGHGTPPKGSKKWHGLIPRYQCFIDDIFTVTEYVQKQVPGKPVVLYGHSMGGNIVLNTLLRSLPQQTSIYSCAILESPWLGLYDPINLAMVIAIKVLSRVMPNLINKQKLDHNALSSDIERAERYSQDILYHGLISMRMIGGILNGCKYAMKNAVNMRLPTYLAYASNELIVCNKEILKFANKAGDIVTAKEYVSNHAIHNDDNRDLLCDDMVKFIELNI